MGGRLDPVPPRVRLTLLDPRLVKIVELSSVSAIERGIREIDAVFRLCLIRC